MEWIFLHEPEEGFEEMTMNPYQHVDKMQKLKNYAFFLLKLAIARIH